MRTYVPSPVRPVAVLLLVALLACGGPLEGPPPDAPAEPPTEPPSGPPLQPAQRRLSGPPGPLTVGPWAAAPLTVTLTELGQPVADAPVDFALSAEAGPHRLSALRAVTDATGAASVKVLAAGPEATFAVTALAGGAVPLEVPVRVSPTAAPAGALEVALELPSPSSPPDALRISLYDGGVRGCASREDPALPPLDVVELEGGARTARFEEVTLERPLTVVAVARRFGVNIARGCVESAAARASALVAVALQPVPPDVSGSWRLTHVLALPEGLLGPVEEVAAVLAEAFDAPDDPARWLVQRIEAEAAQPLGVYREPAIARVAAFLDRTVPPEGLGLPGHLLRAATGQVSVSVATEGEVIPGPCGGAVLAERWAEVRFAAPGCPDCPPRRLAFEGAAPETAHPLAGDPFRLELPDHVAAFPLGPLADLFVRRAVWPGLAPGATDTRGLLLDLVGCRGVGEAIAASDGLDDGRLGIGVHVADADTLALACEAALDGLADRADSVLARQAHTLHPPLTAGGAARWVRSDPAVTRPDRIAAGAWCGTLSAPWGEDPLCATFEGVRLE